MAVEVRGVEAVLVGSVMYGGYEAEGWVECGEAGVTGAGVGQEQPAG